MENIAKKLLRPIIRRSAAHLPEPEGSALRESLRQKAFAQAFEGKAENLTVALLRARRGQSDEEFEKEARDLLSFQLSRAEWLLLDGFMGGSNRVSITATLVEKGLPPHRVELLQKLLRQRLRVDGPQQAKAPMASAAAAAATGREPVQGSLWSRLSARVGRD